MQLVLIEDAHDIATESSMAGTVDAGTGAGAVVGSGRGSLEFFSSPEETCSEDFSLDTSFDGSVDACINPILRITISKV
jgi:hypothetical protein